MTTHITPIQLYFLTFSYLLSGFYLYHIDSFFAVAAQFSAFFIFTVLATGGLSRRRSGLSDLVSFYTPGFAGTAFTGIFLVLSAFQMTSTVVFYGEFVERLCGFLPSWILFAGIVFCAVFAVRRGMMTIGRFAELIPFLLVPVAFVRPFGDFSPALTASDFDVSGVLSCVSSVPVFFLAAKTVTPGDEGVSEAMRAGGKLPEHRAAYLLRIMIAGAVSAVFVYLYLRSFIFPAGDVFLSLFLWMLHIIRLSVLVGVYADLVVENENPKVRTGFTMVFAAAVISMFTVVAGAGVRRNWLDIVIIAVDCLIPVILNGVLFLRRAYSMQRRQFGKKKI